jgi:hypothetical protein
MTLDTIFDTFKIFYEFFINLYNNICNIKEENDIIYDITFNEIYKEKNNLQYFENNIMDISSHFNENTMNLSKHSGDKELFSEVQTKENTMNLSKHSGDKELFSEVQTKENTMNLSKQSGDKELFSEERSSKENTINLSEKVISTKENINLDDIYNKEKNIHEEQFWNKYYQSE